MNWKSIYCLPLVYTKRYSTTIKSANKDRILDFVTELVYPNSMQLNRQQRELVVNILNGEDLKFPESHVFTSSDNKIYADGKLLLLVRKWQYITQGIETDPADGEQAQTEFTAYILDKLNNSNPKQNENN